MLSLRRRLCLGSRVENPSKVWFTYGTICRQAGSFELTLATWVKICVSSSNNPGRLTGAVVTALKYPQKTVARSAAAIDNGASERFSDETHIKEFPGFGWDPHRRSKLVHGTVVILSFYSGVRAEQVRIGQSLCSSRFLTVQNRLLGDFTAQVGGCCVHRKPR